VSRLIAVCLQELDMTPEQKVILGQLRDDLIEKMEPGRAAGRDLANLLADGVATGTVDDAKAELAVARVREASAGLHQAAIDGLNRLHETLTPAQRTALIERMQGRWAVWSDTKRDVDESGKAQPRDMAVLAQKLGLSQEQVDRIEARFTSSMQGVLLDYYPREVAPRMQAFGSAFEGETFDAKTLPTAPPADPSNAGPPATFGPTRMVRFFEAFAPELTPDQRAKLAQDIREHASRHYQP
jgi:Spy/CpxP family protein refolding chaperone